jgi:hypothetical protein
MLQLLKLFTGMILQVTISFVVLHCTPVAWRIETLINININLNMGRTEVKENGFCDVFDCWVYNTECHQRLVIPTLTAKLWE